MSSLHRILKYTPTVVLTLLVLAWVVSIFRDIGFYSTIPATRGLATLKIGNADIFFRLDRRIFSNVEFATRGPARFTDDPIQLKHVLGCFLFVDNARGPRVDVIIDNLGRYAVRIPLLLLITAILPLAIGSFTSFRFRLWHCLAFTALIAAELAYYFRWQEWIA